MNQRRTTGTATAKPTASASSSSQYVPRPRGQVEVAHEERIYQMNKTSILTFWISASASVFIFPILCIFSELVIYNKPPQTKDIIGVVKQQHFQQGVRLGAGIGISIFTFFYFLYNFVFVPPSATSQLHNSNSAASSSPMIFQQLISWLFLFGIEFVCFKFIIQPNLALAPDTSNMYLWHYYNSDDDNSFMEDDAPLSNDVDDQKSVPPPHPVPISFTSNCCDSPNTMTLPPLSEEEAKREVENRRNGIEKTVGLAMMTSMIILIVGGAVALSVAIKWLHISL